MSRKQLQGEDLTKHLDSLEREGMAITRQWFDMWRTAVMYVWNDQLEGIKKNPDWDYVVINHIYPLVMQGIAKLAKNNPKILGRAWKDENAEYAEQWQGLIQYIWEQRLSMRLDMIQLLLNAAVFGYGIGDTYWDHRFEWDDAQQAWIGEIRHRIIHPATFWVDASASRIADAYALGTVRKVRLEWALRQWPEYEKELREEADRSQELDDYEYSDSFGSYSASEINYTNQKAEGLRGLFGDLVSLIFGREKGHEDAVRNAGEEVKYVWLRQTYFRDPYEERVTIEDYVPSAKLAEQGRVTIEQGTGIVRDTATGEPLGPDTHPREVVADYRRPIFPRGRFVIRVGKTILNPEITDQVNRQRNWRFTVMPHHILPHMWQGSNAVELSRGPQDMLNITAAHLIHHVQVNSNPQKVVETQAFARDKRGHIQKIKQKAGEILVMQRGKIHAIRNLDAPPLGQEVFALFDLLKRDIETQQFMHETAQGIQGRAKTAEEAARLDRNANDLISLRAILVDKWVEATGINISQLAQEHYDIGRRVRVIGPMGSANPAQISQEMKDVDWDLEVEPGSTLPFDEQLIKQDYLTAYKLLADPIPNPMLEDVLRKLNIANREKILSRHRQTQLFRQFVQMSAQLTAAQPETPEQAQAIMVQAMPAIVQLMEQVATLGQRPQQADD